MRRVRAGPDYWSLLCTTFLHQNIWKKKQHHTVNIEKTAFPYTLIFFIAAKVDRTSSLIDSAVDHIVYSCVRATNWDFPIVYGETGVGRLGKSFLLIYPIMFSFLWAVRNIYKICDYTRHYPPKVNAHGINFLAIYDNFSFFFWVGFSKICLLRRKNSQNEAEEQIRTTMSSPRPRSYFHTLRCFARASSILGQYSVYFI